MAHGAHRVHPARDDGERGAVNDVRRSMLAVYNARAMAYWCKRAIHSDYAIDDEISLRDLRDAWQRMGGDLAELDAIDAAHLARYRENVRRMKRD